jgi:protein-disulfide isomerase
MARNANLDEKQFESCLSGGKYRAQVERDLQDGIRAGVMGTPGIFINGILLSGAQPEATFERVIESELAVAKEKRASH